MRVKALVLEAPNRLVLSDVPKPTPGPGEVLIRVAAASICHTDFFTIAGNYPGTKFPTIPGHEFSGVVEAVGGGVAHLAPGDTATCLGYSYCGTCRFCRRGQHNGCPEGRAIPFKMDGAFAEYIAVPATMAYPFDLARLSFGQAALIEPAANGYAAVDLCRLRPCEHVVVLGPGPIGLFATQAARLKSPATLTMVGTRRERLELAARLGATHTVNVREADAYEVVMDATGGAGADAVLFCVGARDAWDLGARILAHHGRFAVEALPPEQASDWPISVFDFTAKALTYVGVCGYTADHFQLSLDLAAAGKIETEPVITHRFALEDYEEAFETSERRLGGAVKVLFDIWEP